MDQSERIMFREFMKAVRKLLRRFAQGSSAYRPDLYYIRGPGPKWHTKYGSITNTSPIRADGATEDISPYERLGPLPSSSYR
jgi:hypothetical protein